MRTWFEIEETDVYLTVRETLLRRCGTWAAARGLIMVPSLAEALRSPLRYLEATGLRDPWALPSRRTRQRSTPRRRSSAPR